MTYPYSEVKNSVTTRSFLNCPLVLYEDEGGFVYESRNVDGPDDKYFRGYAIRLPFVKKGLFTKDVSAKSRIRMTRELIKTGLFQKIVVREGQTGWLPLFLTLNYDGISRKGILMYPDEF